MTRTIKNNLIRVLTFVVAITCAFSILTMPRTSASADASVVAPQDRFYMQDGVKLNATSEDKSGLQFSATAHINWARYTAEETSLGKLYQDAKDFVFGIVIDEKYYRDENGDIQERTEVTADSETAIKIGYVHRSYFETLNPATGQSWFTGGLTTYTASITYRNEILKRDFISINHQCRLPNFKPRQSPKTAATTIAPPAIIIGR